MAFRDDHDALLARSAALERELAEAHSEPTVCAKRRKGWRATWPSCAAREATDHAEANLAPLATEAGPAQRAAAERREREAAKAIAAITFVDRGDRAG